MMIHISDAALEKMRIYKKEGLNTDQICDKLRSDGFSEGNVSSVKALLSGRLKDRRKIETKTIHVNK